MLRYLRRFSTKTTTSDPLKRKMAPRRYFPNPSPAYNGQEIDTSLGPKLAEKLIKDIEKSTKQIIKDGGEGLYLGTAGIAYMYYHLSKNPAFSNLKNQYLTKAVEFLTPALDVSGGCSQQDLPSLMVGNAGIYAVASAVYGALGDKGRSESFRKLFVEAGPICKDLSFLSCGSDEFLVGRAGYVFGALFLAKETNTELPASDIYVLCNLMVESGRQYAQTHGSQAPLMYSYYNVEYLGAAHGLCIILQALITVPGYLDAHPTQAILVKNSVDYLLNLQDSDGNFPVEIGGGNELVHWCHGAPGVIYLMAKAYLVWKDPKYLKSCELMGDLIWRKGLLTKGPGICHGVAGNGYAFLLLYRLTERLEYLYKAFCFAKFMQGEKFINEARTPDYPFSLYEGTAGTVCFLGDLACPQQAVFPFSDVF